MMYEAHLLEMSEQTLLSRTKLPFLRNCIWSSALKQAMQVNLEAS